MIGASLNGTRPAQMRTSACRGEKLIRSIPNRARSKRLAAVAMNSIAQHAVPNGIGHRELARAQLTRKSRRVATQPSCDSGAYETVRRSGALNPIATSPRLSVLVPLQRPFLPDVRKTDEKNQHEHQHLA